MIKPVFYTRLLLAGLLLCGYNCKHKEKQVVTVIKKETGRKPRAKAKVGTKNPGGNNSGSTELQQKLGINAKQVRENKLYSFIDDWYGVPYKYGGCQKEGVDCSCFANLLYEKVYDKKIARSSVDIYNACDKISVDEARTGDLVFFKIGGNTISHVGVFIKNKLFVHASNSKGVIINSLDEAYYKKYFFCAGKMKNA
jgi:lipoprotein Spr